MKYEIYQITSKDCEYHFRDYSYIVENNIHINPNDYSLVYTGEYSGDKTLTEGILEGIFWRLNVQKPRGFKGCSPSVSDIFVLKNGMDEVYFVDYKGFKRLS